MDTTYTGKTVNGVPFDEAGNVEVSTGVNTSFVEIPYTSIMSVAYNDAQPNFEVYLTGDLNLTVTGTVNGNSGLVNLYFSGTQTAIVNGLEGLFLTGNGNMIPIYYVHDTNGIRWSEVANPNQFAQINGTILYHTVPSVNTGTVSSIGTNWTTAGFSMVNKYLGAKLTVNGQTTIINSVNQDAGTFTTINPIPATNASFEIKCIALKVFTNGSFCIYEKNGDSVFLSDVDGYIVIGSNFAIDTSGNLTSYAQKIELNEKVYLRNDGSVQSSFKEDIVIYTFDTLPTFGSGVRVYASISDGVTPVYMTPASGGGTSQCSVYWNGITWLYK